MQGTLRSRQPRISCSHRLSFTRVKITGPGFSWISSSTNSIAFGVRAIGQKCSTDCVSENWARQARETDRIVSPVESETRRCGKTSSDSAMSGTIWAGIQYNDNGDKSQLRAAQNICSTLCRSYTPLSSHGGQSFQQRVCIRSHEHSSIRTARVIHMRSRHEYILDQRSRRFANSPTHRSCTL